MSDFSKEFLTSLGHFLDIADAAKQGKAPDRISVKELAELVSWPNKRNAQYYIPDSGQSSSVDSLATKPSSGGNHFSVLKRLRSACQSGQLPALGHYPVVGGKIAIAATEWHTHQDDARLFFLRLGVFPEENSPLWCWLTAWRGPKERKPTAKQRRKADFQQLCIQEWIAAPTVPIAGLNGMVPRLRQVHSGWHYADSTLEEWARAVAPPEVSERVGRPPKKMTDSFS